MSPMINYILHTHTAGYNKQEVEEGFFFRIRMVSQVPFASEMDRAELTTNTFR